MENKQQTAVNWLIENLMINGLIRLTKEEHGLYKEITGLAKQMEQEQIENARPQIISNCVIKEIADDDIKRRIKKEYNYTHYEDRLWMVQGAVWYKEQLKKQQ